MNYPPQPNSAADKLLLTAREAARRLSISERTLWAITAPRGPLRCVRIGTAVRYSITDLAAWIAGQRGGDDSDNLAANSPPR